MIEVVYCVVASGGGPGVQDRFPLLCINGLQARVDRGWRAEIYKSAGFPQKPKYEKIQFGMIPQR